MSNQIFEPSFDRKKRVIQPGTLNNDNVEYAVIGKNDKFSNGILYRLRRYISKKPTNSICEKENNVNLTDSVIQTDNKSEKQKVNGKTKERHNKKQKTEHNKTCAQKCIQTNPPSDLRTFDDEKVIQPKPTAIPLQKSEYQREYRPWTPKEIEFISKKKTSQETKTCLKSKTDKSSTMDTSIRIGKTSEYKSNYKSPSDSRAENEKESNGWYEQILELRALANEYEERGRGMHFSRNHFMQLISSNAKMWDDQFVGIPEKVDPQQLSPEPMSTVEPPTKIEVLNEIPKTKVGKKKTLKKPKCSVGIQTTNEVETSTQTNGEHVDNISIGVNTENKVKYSDTQKPSKLKTIRPQIKELGGSTKRKKLKKVLVPLAYPEYKEEHVVQSWSDPLAFTGNMRPKTNRSDLLERAKKRNDFWCEF